MSASGPANQVLLKECCEKEEKKEQVLNDRTVLKPVTLCQKSLNFQFHVKLWKGSWKLAKQASRFSPTQDLRRAITGRKHEASNYIPSCEDQKD